MRKVKTLAICLPEEQIEQVKRVANLQGRSVSQAISRLLQVALLHANLEVQPGVNVHDRLHMLAAYMLEHRLDGMTEEQIEEALGDGNT